MTPYSSGDFQRKLDEFQRHVHEKARRIEALHGRIAIPELLNEAFMQRHTTFDSAQAFFDAFPPMAATGNQEADEIRSLLETPEWDIHVATQTPFATWRDMLHAATQELLRDELA